jgi:hypothetical protein
VPLGIGAGLLAVDLLIDRKTAPAQGRPRFESDVDHMGGV